MTKNQIKEKIINLITRDIGNSQDNLYRAKRAFRDFSEEQLSREHGTSGQTPKEIMAEYQRVVDETEECLDWIKLQ